eukprot:m.81292 g.81292  ORF g.81292 m.81292 type:complete len:71 (-) comp12628_c1_seq1:159-371(-)
MRDSFICLAVNGFDIVSPTSKLHLSLLAQNTMHIVTLMPPAKRHPFRVGQVNETIEYRDKCAQEANAQAA